MKKPSAKTVKIMDWWSMESFIEKKYKCNLRDFFAHKHGLHNEKYGTSGYNVRHQRKWEEEHYPKLIEFRKNPCTGYGMNQEGMDFYRTIEGRKWFDSIRTAYQIDVDGECKELPHQDFWNFLCDKFNLSNGITCQINWYHLKDECDEDWQREICGLFVKEFGKKDMDVEFSW